MNPIMEAGMTSKRNSERVIYDLRNGYGCHGPKAILQIENGPAGPPAGRKGGILTGKSQREKGKRGERELSTKLREYGYDCRRGQQYCGANGDADVLGLPGIHIECKRVERLNIQVAMEQSKQDAEEGEFPAVFHRRDRSEWLVTMRLEDWVELFREWDSGNQLQKEG